ncbi:MAG TPA: alpha/beta fold hydrolase [Terriglobales bacterium]|nr:alpha/beta fold hydrolase [Terriglobales bacterium]
MRTQRRAAYPTNHRPRKQAHRPHPEADTPIWSEVLCAAEILLLHATPVYYGFGVPQGDDSAVVIIPGFLGTDLYLMELHGWLGRIGYRPYFSGIGLNADCPNLLIQHHLNETVEKALRETGRRIHLIGHSLGGVIARSVAGQRPKDVASVITLASPIRGTVANRTIIHAAEAVRLRILQEHGEGVLPHCYTGACTCRFVDHVHREVPDSTMETAIYTKHDGIVDWRYCMTKKAGNDFEVAGTHIGMAFNATAYSIVAERLALAHSSE